MHQRNGSSVIRLVVLVAFVAIAAVVIFIVINPAGRIRAKRNARRESDVAAIVRAVQMYRADTGMLPPGIDADEETVQMIGDHPGDCSAITCPGHLLPAENCATELAASLRLSLDPLPFDPKTGTDGDTRYFINVGARDAVIVGACDAESADLSGAEAPPVIEAMWW